MTDNLVVVLQEHSGGTIRELIVSYLRAVERFRVQDPSANDRSEPAGVKSLGRSALAEALDWADAIDTYLFTQDNSSTKWPDDLPELEKELARAFQRVRNVVHHQWWQVVGVRIDVPNEGAPTQWVWGNLPERKRGDGSPRDKAGDAAYETRLEGRPVLGTLDELAALFWPRRRWEITRADLEQPGHSVGTELPLDVKEPSDGGD